MRWFYPLLVLLGLGALIWQSPFLPMGQQALRAFFAPRPPAPLMVSEMAGPLAAMQPNYVYTPPKHGFLRHEFEFAGQTRHFWMLSSQAKPQDSASPQAVLLLHGAGRDGRSMLDMWRGIAAKGVVLIAPDSLDTVWSLDADGAAFQAAVLAQAMAIASYDPEKVNLYGHSSGGNMALALGNCTDLPIKAIALHAGAFSGCGKWPALDRRYLIQIGDQDESFPLDVVRGSAQRIADAGFPVDLVIIKGHNHWYYEIGPKLALQAWAFFQGQFAR